MKSNDHFLHYKPFAIACRSPSISKEPVARSREPRSGNGKPVGIRRLLVNKESEVALIQKLH